MITKPSHIDSTLLTQQFYALKNFTVTDFNKKLKLSFYHACIQMITQYWYLEVHEDAACFYANTKQGYEYIKAVYPVQPVTAQFNIGAVPFQLMMDIKHTQWVPANKCSAAHPVGQLEVTLRCPTVEQLAKVILGITDAVIEEEIIQPCWCNVAVVPRLFTFTDKIPTLTEIHINWARVHKNFEYLPYYFNVMSPATDSAGINEDLEMLSAYRIDLMTDPY